MPTLLKSANFSGSNGSHFKINLYYDYTQDTNSNTTTITYSLYFQSQDQYSGSGSAANGYINGGWVGSTTSISRDENKYIGETTVTVRHNADGTFPGAYYSASMNCPWNTVGNASLEGTLTGLPTIPRGTTITYFNVIPQNETSVLYSWSATDPCDWAWYSIDGGANWNNLQQSNIIVGLSPDTPYVFQLLVRRTDTQVQTPSSLVQARTYDYPKVTSTGDFTIGNKCRVDLYNPLGRNVTLDLISNNDGSVIGTYTGNGKGIIEGFDDPTSINKQYSSIPDRMASTYYARVTYGSSIKTYGNGVYSITGDVKPVITIDAEDTNKTLATGNKTCNLTGSNKKFIKFMSNANVTLEATAQKGSKIKSTYIKYSGDTRPTSIIDTTRIQTETFTNIENVTFTGNATDTREQSLQTPISATGLTLVPYVKLTLENVSLYRQNQTSDTLYCSGDGDYFNDTFGSVANTITFKYRYKESSVSSWEGISWNTQSVTVGSGNEYSFDFQVGTTFDYTKTYNFQFEVSDACMLVTDSQDAKPGVPVQGLFENFHEAFGVKTFERDNDGDVLLNVSKKYKLNGTDIITKSGNDIVLSDNVKIPDDFKFKTLNNGTNINNLTEAGIFGIYNATGTLPIGYSTSDNNIFIQNMLWDDGTYGRQIFYDIRTNSTYSREKSQGSWTSWEKINSIEYSNNDIVIGKWINNKPVYRRVIHATNLIVQPSGYSVAVGLTNPSEIIRIDLSLRDSRNDWYTFWHLTDIIYRHNRNAVDVYGDSSATFDEAYIIIEYTKTTD